MKEKRDEFEVGKQQAMTDTYQEQVEKLGEARRKAAELLNEDLNEVTECFLVVLCVCVCGVFFFFFCSFGYLSSYSRPCRLLVESDISARPSARR